MQPNYSVTQHSEVWEFKSQAILKFHKEVKRNIFHLATFSVVKFPYIQCSPIIMLCLGSIRMDCVFSVNIVIKGQLYKGLMGAQWQSA